MTATDQEAQIYGRRILDIMAEAAEAGFDFRECLALPITALTSTISAAYPPEDHPHIVHELARVILHALRESRAAVAAHERRPQ